MGFKEVLHKITRKEEDLPLHPLVKQVRSTTKNLEKLLKGTPNHEGLFNGIESASGALAKLGTAVEGGRILVEQGRRRIFIHVPNVLIDGNRRKVRIHSDPEENVFLVLHSHEGFLGESSLDDVHMFITEPKQMLTADRKGSHPMRHTILVANVLTRWGKALYKDGVNVSRQIKTRSPHPAR